MTINEVDFKASCQHTIPCYCGAKEIEKLRTELEKAETIIELQRDIEEISENCITEKHQIEDCCHCARDIDKLRDVLINLRKKYFEEKEKSCAR